LSARQAGGRETEILAVALERFSRSGYRDTTLQDIADEIGITRPAFYHYFASKEDLLWRLVEDLGLRLLDEARPIAASNAEPLTKIRLLVHNHVITLVANTAAFRIYLQERALLEGERDERLRREEDEYARVVRTVITEAQASSVVRTGDPSVLALLLLGLGNSVLRWYTNIPGGLSPAQLAEEVATTVLSGLRGK
jgi:AcrR family transcriptional regulator